MISGLVLKYLKGERFAIRRHYSAPCPGSREVPLTRPRETIRGKQRQPSLEVRLCQEHPFESPRNRVGIPAQIGVGYRDGGRWRRRWDSNPRYALTHAGFQDRCNRPLCHSSGRGHPYAGRFDSERALRSGFPLRGRAVVFHCGLALAIVATNSPVGGEETGKKGR